jgi:hypothetical protein
VVTVASIPGTLWGVGAMLRGGLGRAYQGSEEGGLVTVDSNYVILVVGLGLVLLWVLLWRGASDDPSVG